VIRTISGVYSSEYKSDDDFKEAKRWLQNLPKKRAASQGLWLPRWARMVTIGEQKLLQRVMPI